jgi:hemerythrin superfamily protein
MAKRSTQLLNALDLLTEQHEEVDALFAQLEAGGDNRQAAFVELADKLAAHATIEEKLFYPRVVSNQTSELLHQSVEEHLAIKRVLADLVTMDLDTDQFHAKLAVLKEEVTHHAHELLVMFEQLLASQPRLEVPNETTQAAPLPA